MDLKLNFLGLTVADFKSSYRFYTQMLGIQVKHSRSDWAAFKTKGVKFELFSGAKTQTRDSSSGEKQTIKGSFQIANLKKTISDLRLKGVEFIGEIKKTVLGESIEFIAPEGICWTFAYAPYYPFSPNLLEPHLGWIEMKTYNLAQQQAFYTDVMRLQKSNSSNDQIIFRQKKGEPLLLLESAGQVSTNKNYADNPFLISFETDNIKEAFGWIKSHKISTQTGISSHSWGIDFMIEDTDGNPIQIVQYT